MDYIVHIHNVCSQIESCQSRISWQHLRKPLPRRVYITKIKSQKPLIQNYIKKAKLPSNKKKF